MYGYLNQHWVQQALGVPVNFSAVSMVVNEAFQGTADIERAGALDSVSYLLEHGIKVHMVYGDRDFICNWIGGESASLAVEYSGSEKFASAGYAPLLTSEGVRGYTRQYGNYSFTRVRDSGHEGMVTLLATTG